MPISFFKFIKRPNSARLYRIEPAESLRPFIEGFYSFTLNEMEGGHLLFNDGFPVVVAMPDTRLESHILVNGKRITLSAMWACGGVLKNMYWQAPAGSDNIFVVRFYPYAFYDLFSIDNSLFNRKPVFDFSEIAGAGFGRLTEALYSAAAEAGKMQAFERFISERTATLSYPPLLEDALHLIAAKEGRLSVKELLRLNGMASNYKWLERTFRKHVGMSPQRYIQLQRFVYAYLDLDGFSSKDLRETASQYGYYDENHLIKDFRQYLGMSPKAWFKKQELDFFL